jgi:hypothetical protein
MKHVQRRHVGWLVGRGAALLLLVRWEGFADAEANQSSEQMVTFEWQAPAAQASIVRQNLTYTGSETAQTDGRGVPLLAIFVGAVLLPYLAKAVIEVQRQFAHGGTVVDMRGPTVKILSDKALDGGVIVVVRQDGTTSIERNETDGLAALVAAIAKALRN